MSTCIFCGSDGPFASVSHIVPESLVGSNGPVAAGQTTCDPCNHYFGQKVESAALSTFPFNHFRLFSSIPSKKGRLFSMPTTAGMIAAAGRPGQLELKEPTEKALAFIGRSETGQFRLLAEVTEPLAVARMLIKVGIETLAKHHDALARSARFAAAREFCRRPRRGQRWWFAIQTEASAMFMPRTHTEAAGEIDVGEAQGCAYCAVRLLGLAAFTPLEPNAQPMGFDPEDPTLRLCWPIC